MSNSQRNTDAFLNEEPLNGLSVEMPPLEGDDESLNENDSQNSLPKVQPEAEASSAANENTNPSEQSGATDTTFNGYNEEDLADLGKIASMLKTLSADMKEVKEGQGKILGELNVIKEDHKKMSEKLEQHSKDIKGLQDYQTENDKALNDIVEIVYISRKMSMNKNIF